MEEAAVLLRMFCLEPGNLFMLKYFVSSVNISLPDRMGTHSLIQLGSPITSTKNAKMLRPRIISTAQTVPSQGQGGGGQWNVILTGTQI